MKKPWKKISSKIVHKNPWYFVRQDAVVRPDGKPGTYYVVVSHPAVYIVPVTAKKEVVLIDIYRYPTDMFSIEVPAGNSDGQKPLVAAKRELREETGLTARIWKKIGKPQARNGLMSQIDDVFLATELSETNDHAQHEEGIVGLRTVSFKKVFQMIKAGEISDAPSIAALTLAALELDFL